MDGSGGRAKPWLMDEDALVKKLQQIERSLAGSAGVGVEACRAELAAWREREADKEFRVSVPTPTAQRVLLGWCLRYGFEPHRVPRERKSTICIRVPEGFMNEVLWPRVEAMAQLIEHEAALAATRIVERWSGLSLTQHQKSVAQSELFNESQVVSRRETAVAMQAQPRPAASPKGEPGWRVACCRGWLVSGSSIRLPSGIMWFDHASPSLALAPVKYRVRSRAP